MAQITEQNKELWIDLHTIDTAGSHKYDDNLTCMYLQFFNKNDTQLYDQIKYILRVALRALGYKIVKVERILNKDDFSPVCISFYTNLPHDLYSESCDLYNNWIGDTHEERFVEVDNEVDSDEDEAEEEDEWSDIYNKCSFGEFIKGKDTKHLEKYKDYTYYQTYGGGPERGYIVSPNKKIIYEVKRDWMEPFKIVEKVEGKFEIRLNPEDDDFLQVKITK